jgi:hypothetical protein
MAKEQAVLGGMAIHSQAELHEGKLNFGCVSSDHYVVRSPES